MDTKILMYFSLYTLFDIGFFRISIQRNYFLFTYTIDSWSIRYNNTENLAYKLNLDTGD